MNNLWELFNTSMLYKLIGDEIFQGTQYLLTSAPP